MKDSHLTLRLPTALARALARRARADGVPKSHIAREAVARYLVPQPGATEPLRPALKARDLAARWANLPRLLPEEVDDFAADIERGRAELPVIRSKWE